MKKLLMVAVMMLASTSMFAEQGDMWVGASANYALHSDYKNFGIGARLQWEFIDNFRAEPFFNYYFKKDYVSMWEAGVNAQYLINLGKDGFNVYPAVGIGVLGAKVTVPGGSYSSSGVTVTVSESSASDQHIDFSFGAGIEYPVSETIKVFGEAKYRVCKDYNCPVIAAGVAFKF